VTGTGYDVAEESGCVVVGGGIFANSGGVENFPESRRTLVGVVAVEVNSMRTTQNRNKNKAHLALLRSKQDLRLILLVKVLSQLKRPCEMVVIKIFELTIWR